MYGRLAGSARIGCYCFLQDCELDFQWTVNVFMQVKPAALSSLQVTRFLLSDPTARATAMLTLQA